MTFYQDATELIFTSETRVPGETIKGRVVLNVPLLLLYKYEQVHINLRGEIITTIGFHKEEIHLCGVRETRGMWKKADASETDHIVEKPFSFVLPDTPLPASGKFGKGGLLCTWPVKILYYVEIVSTNPDPKKARRLRRPFSYMPRNVEGHMLSRTISSGWKGGWQTVDSAKTLRRGSIWKDFSDAQLTVSLSLPEVAALPVMTDIPFTLNIATIATGKKSTQPAPSAEIARLLGLDFIIMREVRIKAHSKQKTIQELVVRVGSFGTSAEKIPASRMEAKGTLWLPIYDDEKKPTGSWKQDHQIASSLSLRCPPSIMFQTVNVKYFAQVKITCSGTGPDTCITVPLEVVSNRC